mmetsp:Transcript_30825/g.43148  ORF Transcript_30825/g.43148 Transcript_30825/m.43148 type:complete len:410 (-) Transcript_30825:99-1328(-)
MMLPSAGTRAVFGSPEDEEKFPYPKIKCNLHDPKDPLRVEHWYKILGEATFKTQVTPLSHPEARLLCKLYETQRMLLSLIYSEKKKSGKSYGAINWDSEAYTAVVRQSRERISPEEAKTLEGVIQKLEGGLKAMDAAKLGAFVRLSTRSAKDAALNSEKIKYFIRQEIEASSPLATNNTDSVMEIATEDLRIYTRACSFALRCHTVDDVLRQFTSSTRIYHDIMRVELNLGEKAFDLQLVFRKWEDIDPEREFRCFVYNGKLTAATQYYKETYVPEFKTKRKEIENCIRGAWDRVKMALAKVPIPHYAIDVIVPKSFDPKDAWVVELNYFAPHSGQALFSWHNKADRLSLHQLPFELRILESPLTGSLSRIHPPLKKFIDDLRGRTRPSTEATETEKNASKDRKFCGIQ